MSNDSYFNTNNVKKYNAEIFSTFGVSQSASILYNALISHYQALRRDMFRWEDDSGLCKNMFLKSRNHAPEENLVSFGEITFFKLKDDIHALPISEFYKLINVYGYLDEWRAVSSNPNINQMLSNMPLNHDNAVICQDSLIFTNESRFIENVVLGMVDILLSMRQRSILNRQPFIFTLPNINDKPKKGEAGSIMDAILSCSPYIVTTPETADFKVFQTQSNVDVGITDYFSFLETLILTVIGYDATDVHKRAQQSIPETMLAQDKILARRHEKLKMREYAADRCNELFGTNLKVISVLDGYDSPKDTSVLDSYPELNDYMSDENESL